MESSMYYILNDHLGSVYAITDDIGDIIMLTEEGTVYQEGILEAAIPEPPPEPEPTLYEQVFSFDAWGNRRDPNDWTMPLAEGYPILFDSGFTSHRHWDEFGLINMIGRVYDPRSARFLSPDNYVQMPDFTQSFNRYSYCLNNPLKYTDPSGEWFFTALLAPFGLAPLGVIIDGACWSATIDAGIQGVKMATGTQDSFNWAELGGAAVGGAVFAGVGLMAPEFTVSSTSFAKNLPKYLGKAGWATFAGGASAGSGMLANDLFDNGQIDFHGSDYLKAMGIGGLISGGLSFAGSLYDYHTWDKLSYDEKVSFLKKKYGNQKITFDENLQRSSRYDPNTGDIIFGKDGLTSKGWAKSSYLHENIHAMDFANQPTVPSHIHDQKLYYDFLDSRAYRLELQKANINHLTSSKRRWLMMKYASYSKSAGVNTIYPLGSRSSFEPIYNLW